MNITDIIKNTSTAEHAELLAGFLSAVFGEPYNGFGTAQRPTPESAMFLRQRANGLLDAAAVNAEKIAEIGVAESDALAQSVFDEFNTAACEVNNGGFEEQVRYLIVEAGYAVEKVEEAKRQLPLMQSSKTVKVEFERFLWSADGKSRERETATVKIDASRDLADLEERAYDALFLAHPDWERGLPLKNGRGWSSALLVQMPQ